MRFEAKIECFPAMIDWIREGLKGLGVDPSALKQIELASEEALVNVIQYAQIGQIEIDLKVFPSSHIEVIIRDQGVPFNPLEKEALLSDDIEEREPGGLGIHLMKQCMDEVRYQRDRDTNILVLVKKITHSSRKK